MILCCVVIPSARVVNQLLTPNLGKQNKTRERPRVTSTGVTAPLSFCIRPPRLPPSSLCGGTVARPSGQEVEGLLVEAAAAAALSTSVVVGELSAQEMGCHSACLLAIILAS